MNWTDEPICSVCVANYNGEALLEECLDSILAQQGAGNIEIIVHDDASSDGSIALLQHKYPQVRLLNSSSNVGFCISNNRMAEVARGRYLLLLNNDASLFPDAIATLVATAQAQPDSGILTLAQYDHATSALVDRGCLLDLFYNPVPNTMPSRADTAMVIGACLFLPRDLWNEMGGFPEWIESIGEDLYLCCVARLSGHYVRVADRSGYRHRQGASFGGNRVTDNKLQTTYRRRRLSERNKLAVMLLCTPGPLAWLLWTIAILSLLVEGVALTMLRGNPRIWSEIYGPALSATFKSFADLRARRAKAQAIRTVSLSAYLRAFVPWPQKLRLAAKHGLPTIR